MRWRGGWRWVLPSLLLLAAAVLLYGWLVGFEDTLPVDSPVAVLSLTLFVLILGLVAVLVRNLVRLIVDRKRGILGSRLRTKLVFFFLALVLLPSIVLFYGSAQVINQTVEAILRTPLEDLSRESGEIVDEWRGYFQNHSLGMARNIVEEIEAGALLEGRTRVQMEALLERFRRQHELQIVQLDRGSDVLARALQTDLAATEQTAVPAHVADLAVQVAARGEPDSRISRLSNGLLAHAALPLAGNAGPASVISVGVVLPPRLAQDLDGFARAEQNYAGFRAQRRDLVRLYLTLIGLIFTVTLFVATWVGFYLSRRITVPIQDLAAATREIASGNLHVRVQTPIGDELGMLVDAFNDMAGELQENREVITRSTADLRRSNQALDDRRRYIETLLANLSTAVISMDTRGLATTANPAVKSILGIDLKAGDDVREVLRKADLMPLEELLVHSRGEESIHRDLVLQRDGETVQVAAYASPLGSGGGDVVGTLLMVEDLTELVRAQRAAAWREVARRIAHEIKNPLTPIQLAAQRLRKKFTEGSDDLDRVLPEATAAIEREVSALKHLVDEFSSFARMPEVAPQLVAFDEVVESVLALYKGLTEIRWEVNLDPEIGRSLMDPQQMRRVLINLIDNAVAAMNGQGTIGIGARAAADNVIRIEVADSGPGIPPSDRDKMFEPYFSTKHRGTGLGLAIVHKVVTDHRGTIRVENNEPHGARFVIEIPT